MRSVSADLSRTFQDSEFRTKYETLKRVYEGRITSLADTVRHLAKSVAEDEVTAALKEDPLTSSFASLHAVSLVEDGLSQEREAFISELADSIATAEVIAGQRRAELASLARLNDDLRLKLASAAKEIVKAKEAEALGRDVVELRNEYKNALEGSAAEIARLTGANEELRLRLEQGENARAGLHQLSKELADGQTRASLLEKDLSTSRSKSEELSRANMQLKEKIMTLESALSVEEGKVKTATEAASSAEVRLRQAAGRMELLVEAEARDSGSALKALKEKATLARDRLAEDTRRERHARKELGAQLLAAKEGFQAQKQMLEDQIRQLSADLALERRERSADTKKVATSTSEVAALTEELSLARHSLQAAAERHAMELASVNRALASATNTVKRLESDARDKERAWVEEREKLTTSYEQAIKQRESVVKAGVGEKSQSEHHVEILANRLEEATATMGKLRKVLSDEVKKKEEAEHAKSAAEQERLRYESELQEVQSLLHQTQQEISELRSVVPQLENLADQSLSQLKERDRKLMNLQASIDNRKASCAKAGRKVLNTMSTLRTGLDTTKSEVKSTQFAIKDTIATAVRELGRRKRQRALNKEMIGRGYGDRYIATPPGQQPYTSASGAGSPSVGRSETDQVMLDELNRIQSVGASTNPYVAQIAAERARFTALVADAQRRREADAQDAKAILDSECNRLAREAESAALLASEQLAAEKARCKELQARLQRLTREHQVALAEAESRCLAAQQETERIGQALEREKLKAEASAAQVVRLEKRLQEMETSSQTYRTLQGAFLNSNGAPTSSMSSPTANGRYHSHSPPISLSSPGGGVRSDTETASIVSDHGRPRPPPRHSSRGRRTHTHTNDADVSHVQQSSIAGVSISSQEGSALGLRVVTDNR